PRGAPRRSARGMARLLPAAARHRVRLLFVGHASTAAQAAPTRGRAPDRPAWVGQACDPGSPSEVTAACGSSRPGGRQMRLKKIVVAVTLITFLGSDFTFGIAPALGQSSITGDGRLPMPSLSGDGNFGWGLAGPSPSVPYLVLPQQPLQQPQLQPRYQYVPPPRTVAPATANLSQPGAGVQHAPPHRTRPSATSPARRPPHSTP